jgi:hypothetical protein
MDIILLTLGFFFLNILSFIAGRNFPTIKKQDQIFEKTLIAQQIGRTWECVSVINNPHGGLFGSRLRQILLESNKERILLCYFQDDIKEGTVVQLTPRNPDVNPAHTWVSTIDRLMVPYT